MKHKQYTEFMSEVKRLKQSLKKEMMPQVLKLQKQSFSTQSQKLQVLFKLEKLMEALKGVQAA